MTGLTPNDLEEIPGDERDRHRPAVDVQDRCRARWRRRP